jgi:FPC/CPF motif-containing protein YcgG
MIDPARTLEHLECAWLNPFDSDAARAHSAYHGLAGGELVRLLETATPDAFARVAHESFRAFVLDDAFSCLGAKSSIRRGLYRFGTYARLDDPAVTAGLARDLFAFAAERRGFASDFTTFIAVFRARAHDGEPGFERALWSQLQRLHDLDASLHPWDPRVSDDPEFRLAGAGVQRARTIRASARGRAFRRPPAADPRPRTAARGRLEPEPDRLRSPF